MTPPPALRPCRLRNCVSSQETRDPYRIEPLRFAGDPDRAWRALLDLLRGWPRTRLLEKGPEVARARFRSPVFRFPDNAVFLLDREGQTIHFRSAARWGRRDFDVNRKRMEAIRAAFAAALDARADP
jgi:uncharacterized protein (DUF1499 family)